MLASDSSPPLPTEKIAAAALDILPTFFIKCFLNKKERTYVYFTNSRLHLQEMVEYSAKLEKVRLRFSISQGELPPVAVNITLCNRYFA